MTALAVPPEPAIAPVPARRLAWAAWRRSRAAVLGLGGFLVALATYLFVTGLQAHVAFADLGACAPPITNDPCRIQWESFVADHNDRGITGPLLLILPGIVGAVLGAPTIGRELETGVFRYSWTQGAGRMRWAAATILPLAVVTSALLGLLGLLVTWRDEPMVAGGAAQRLDSSTLPSTGVAVVGWTLLGFSLGVLAGLLWRRVIPAVATGFAIWFGIALIASLLRPQLMTPLTTTGELPTGAMELSEHWTKGGVVVSAAEVAAALKKVNVTMTDDGLSAHADQGGTTPPDPMTYLAQQGYAKQLTYQPDSRFWPFQWIETAWLVLVSTFLLGLALRLVRRRSV